MTMTPDANKKERSGVVLSIGLGLIAGVLTVASFYGAPITFLFFSVLSPLIVSLAVPNKSTALSILANVVHVFSLPIIVTLVLWILRVPWTGLPRGGDSEIWAGLLLALAVAISFAWITSAVVRLVRRKVAARRNPNPDTPA